MDRINMTVVLQYAVRAVGVLLLLVVTWGVASWTRRLSLRAFQRAKLDVTLAKFFSNVVRYALLVCAVLACLSVFGIETTSFAAILGTMGLAIGLSLQGSLANFSAGAMILTFRPFKVGDVVNVAGQVGVVEEVELFTTKLLTPDRRLLIIPNATVFGGIIENITAMPTRRVDVDVGVDYGANIDETRKALEAADPSHQDAPRRSRHWDSVPTDGHPLRWAGIAGA